MMSKETITLPQASPGTSRSISVFRYGKKGAGQKVYIQAGLHADEAPGFMVAHYLKELLDKAEVLGEIILLPAANPIGLSQWRDDQLQGRFDFTNSINFNRSHLELTADVYEKVKELLGDDEEENVKLIRGAMTEVLAEVEPADEAEFLKKQLLTLAHDADIVLDLHCDYDSLFHIYMGTPLWEDAKDLSAQMGSPVTLLASNSGGEPFDEACSKIWWELAEKIKDKPIPPACLSVTVELRGIADTDQDLTKNDAQNIFYFLQRRGIIAGEPPELPALINEATPLTGVDYIKAEAPGIVSYLKKPGAWVKKGDVIAEIINPLPAEGGQAVTQIKTVTDGLLFACNVDKYARPGRIIAKVAGAQPLGEESGNLLTS